MNTQTLSQSSVTVKSNTAIRVVVGVLLSLLSGVMLTAAFAPYDAWPLVFVAFIPMILAQYRIFPAKVSSLGGAIMMGTWVFLYFGPTFFWGGFMLALPLIVFVLNFFIEKGSRKFHAGTHYRWFILSGVVSWVGFEIIRTFIPGIAT
jgi:apolipoprotein N-acyltransferase